MQKSIIYLLAFVIMSVFATAYSVVDYDDILYTGNKSTLMLYGWRNSTTADGLSYCQAFSGVLNCADSGGSARGVHHLFNNVDTDYCLTANNTVQGNASNISQRFTIQLSYSPLVAEVQQLGFSEYYTSTPPSDMKVYIYSNSSGNTKICLRAGATETCPYSAPANNDIHDVQVDYVMVGQANGQVKIQNATIWVDGLNASLNSPQTTAYNCINSSILYFRRGVYLYNLTVIHYNSTDTFLAWNQSVSEGAPASVQCNDGIDNDGDSFTDLDDPQCVDIADDDESPVDLTECNDADDNDGDGLIDYPDDPACSAASDNSEAPYNTYQCNDGSDNDGDGYIDYQNDPSCGSPSDTSELPVDGSIQTEDGCNSGQGCILIDTFPYSDTIYNHNWTDLAATELSDNEYIRGGYSLLFNNYDGMLNTISLTKNFQNDATQFSDIVGDILMEMTTNNSYECGIGCQTNHTLYIILENESSIAIKMKLVIYTQVTGGDFEVKLYNIDNESNEDYIDTYYPSTANGLFNIQYRLDLYTNPADNTITIGSYITHFFNNTHPTRIRFYADDYDSRHLQLYLHYTKLNGELSGSGVCTTFSPPYYLKEQFTYAYLKDCGWTITPDSYYVQGSLDITNDIEYISLYKAFYDSVNKQFVALKNSYVTLSFDYTIYSDSNANNVMSFTIYDNANTPVITNYFYSDGTVSSPTIDFTSVATDTSHNYKIIVNLLSGNYNAYIDGSLAASTQTFDTPDYEYDNLFIFYMQAANAHLQIDNLYVFSSDANGNPLLSPTSAPQYMQNETFLFDLIFKSAPPCTTEADCASGYCNEYSKTCSIYNFKLLDSYGYNRTFWGFIKAFFRGGLEWFVDLILDNLLLFVGLLIILMFFVYLASRFRGG